MSAPEATEALLTLYPRLIESLEACAGGPFVAGVLLDGLLVGWGANTVLRDHDVTRHAEMNALGEAGRRTGRVHLDGAQLVTSHFPCLMCYHAAKWARIREVAYLFDYAETELIFGFHGDSRMLEDLAIGTKALERDGSIALTRLVDPKLHALYRLELPRRWRASYRDRCMGYDV